MILQAVMMMSKYTTEVRFICEQKAGLSESEGANSVDTIIANSWNKIFTTKCAIFNEAYRSVICSKILKHYYLREIGAETVGVWVLWMNTKMEEIMPYYNKLYESAELEFNPFHDVDLTRQHETKYDGKTDTTDNGTRDTTSMGEATSDNTNYDLFSDTPQGALIGVDNETYLSSARKTTDSGNSTDKNTTKESTNTTGTSNTNSTENYIETIKGKQGTESYSDLLNKYRDTLINIDLMIIDEFSDLFMGLW